MTQITPITSEALQASIRRLLPSQVGFGEDLRATNLITPIIDLTPTAEGSVLPTQLQNSIAFDSQSVFSITNANTNIISTTGFHRITAFATVESDGSNDRFVGVDMIEGASLKRVWSIQVNSSFSANRAYGGEIDLILFVNSGQTVNIDCSTRAFARGSVRQVATLNGTLVNPAGFTFE